MRGGRKKQTSFENESFFSQKKNKKRRKAFVPGDKGPRKTHYPSEEHSFWVILSHQHAFSPILLVWIIIQFLSITSRARFFIKQLTRDR